MKAQHTTQQWMIAKNGENPPIGVYIGPYFCNFCYKMPPEECEGNASLIFSAPDLLKDLKAMVYFAENGKFKNGESLESIKKTIIKAETIHID